MTKTKVIFIMSQGHAGSTLLGMILGSHPSIFGLGELARFDKHLPKICGICESSCEYWQGKASLPILMKYFSNGRSLSTLSKELNLYRRSIYSYLAEWFNYSIFVDSSKYPDWIQSQLRYRRHAKEVTPILLHLTRDGRAVINSQLRKTPEKGIRVVTKNWINSTRKILELYDRFDGPKFRLSYESMASSPQETVQRVCEFLDITYAPQMLHYWEHDHHQIGGNTGTRSLISLKGPEESGKAAVKPGAWHDGYYDQMGKTIRIDLRWKEELSLESKEYFEKHAGALNRIFRYDQDQ